MNAKTLRRQEFLKQCRFRTADQTFRHAGDGQLCGPYVNLLASFLASWRLGVPFH